MAASNSNTNHLLVAAALAAALLAVGDASGVGFDLHHRTSSVVRRWAEARGHDALAAHWPAHGSPEYYSALSRHDRALLARRNLAGADGLLAFADGNDTQRISNLGSLYYAEVALGTPNATFLVALDTGSDLFWVPCDCKQCAPIFNTTTQSQGLRPYSPRLSSTSKPVTCAHVLCDQPTACGGGGNSSSCPYTVQYVSANTSSSGFLVEDILYLAREGQGPGRGGAVQPVQAPIVFGCGQVQTGLFLDGGGVPDGLLGLGMEKVSVPSLLASSGLVASDSFSMCFSPDGVGRINFGDAGSRDQAETPFIISSRHPTYNVSFTSINVGNKSVAAAFTAVIDSGTSFTYLKDPEYTQLATNFDSQVQEKRLNVSSESEGKFIFDYCYQLRSRQVEVTIPDVNLTTKGGALFPVTQPAILLADETGRKLLGYCLAIIKSDIPINIIGQNFMTGLKVVFDRERSVLGWQQFDCYKNAKVADAPTGSPSAAAAPAPTTTLTPRQNDASNSNRNPGAAPLPRSAAASRHGGLSLPLMLAAAAAALV